MSMKSISIADVTSGINIPRYINLLLVLVSILVVALLVREYASTGSTAERGGGGLRGLAGTKTPGTARRAFSDNMIIGSSGVLGVRTSLSPIHKRASSRSGGAASTAAADSDVILLGTVTGSGKDDRDFTAIFKNKSGGKEEVVRRGESVFGIGRLVSVSKYRAVVQSGGRRLTFVMDLGDSGKEPVQTPGGSLTDRGRGFGFAGRTPGSRLGAFGSNGMDPFTGNTTKPIAKALGKGKWLIDKRALDEALKDSNRIISDARFYPYREGGVVKGFMLSQVRPSGVFFGLGLKGGDIILRVNDYTIDAPEKAMSLMKGLKGETNVKVDFIRRGHARTYKYEIR